MNHVGLAARAYCNNVGGAVALATTTWTKVPLDTVDPDDDPGSYFDVTSGQGRYNVPNPGTFLVLWVVTAVASATGQEALSGLYRAGALECVGGLVSYSSGAFALMASSGSALVSCDANDYLETYCFVVGASINTNPGRAYTTMSVQQVG